MNKTYGIREFARKIGVSHVTVIRDIEAKRIKTVIVMKPTKQIPASELSYRHVDKSGKRV